MNIRKIARLESLEKQAEGADCAACQSQYPQLGWGVLVFISAIEGLTGKLMLSLSISGYDPEQTNSESGCCNALAPPVALDMSDSQIWIYGMSGGRPQISRA